MQCHSLQEGLTYCHLSISTYIDSKVLRNRHKFLLLVFFLLLVLNGTTWFGDLFVWIYKLATLKRAVVIINWHKELKCYKYFTAEWRFWTLLSLSLTISEFPCNNFCISPDQQRRLSCILIGYHALCSRLPLVVTTVGQCSLTVAVAVRH